MNKLIVSDSIRQILENKPNITDKKLKKRLWREGINITNVSKNLIEELKNSNNFDRELLEIEIMKKSMNINY